MRTEQEIREKLNEYALDIRFKMDADGWIKALLWVLEDPTGYVEYTRKIREEG